MNARTLAYVCATMGLILVSGSAATNARAASPPSLSIVSPANNAVIGNGSSVAVVFVASNFNLSAPGTGPSSPNAGHVEVSVDGSWTSHVSVNAFRLSLASGPHTILLRLVMDNGTGLTPDVAQFVSVTVTRGPAAGPPGLSIAFPKEDAVLGTDLYLSYRVVNFVLVPPGGPAVPNEGHIHVLVDAQFYQELTDYQPVHLGLPDGPHNVTLQVVDSLHRPLSPDVSASAHFTVRALVGRVILVDFTPYFGVTNVGLAFAIIALMYRKLEA